MGDANSVQVPSKDSTKGAFKNGFKNGAVGGIGQGIGGLIGGPIGAAVGGCLGAACLKNPDDRKIVATNAVQDTFAGIIMSLKGG